MTENLPSSKLRIGAVIMYYFARNLVLTKVKKTSVQTRSYLPLKTNCESGLNEASSGKPLWFVCP